MVTQAASTHSGQSALLMTAIHVLQNVLENISAGSPSETILKVVTDGLTAILAAAEPSLK